ncbi:carbonic anhydrase [Benzoatithermus flavus]|uniref:carbonic anhydrase n=1 Tax=Benzoatithermus flavus TaxID=3108223 RepID=A0ABU8XSJ5_9PROT
MPKPITRLIKGFEAFRSQHFEQDPELMQSLATEGQRPEVMVVACSDSRTDPAILTCARPGDLFIVRNVAAIVPPYDPKRSPQGTSSAIEFGVRGLEVQHIVVIGHAQCGGMRFLAQQASAPQRDGGGFEFLGGWVRIAEPGLKSVLGSAIPEAARGPAIEQAGILNSLHNLMSFPWIRERVEAGRLALHGWYYDLASGRMLALDAAAARFLPTQGDARPIVGHTPLPDFARFARCYGPDTSCCSAA